jgi:hypothetical protein
VGQISIGNPGQFIIGTDNPDRDAFVSASDAILFSWEAINSLIVVDDNYMPYRAIDSLTSTPYRVTDIDAFIVPLPEKVYYPAEAVEVQVNELFATTGFPRLDWSYVKQPVIRYFVTTSAKLREYFREQKSALPQELFALVMNLTLPQFVWVVQVAGVREWEQQRCNLTFLVDATASALDEEPFFLLHDRERAFVYDRGDRKVKGWVDFADRTMEYMSEFRKNLAYRN